MKIGRRDYSRSDFKTMFANYGLTAISAVALEKSLLLLMAVIDNLGKGNFPKELLHDYLKKHHKKTIGSLIKEIKKRINISSDLEMKLEKARIYRNQFIHHFFMDEYETMDIPNGPTILSNKLRPIRDFFVEVHLEIDALIGAIGADLSKPRNEISSRVRKLLKSNRS